VDKTEYLAMAVDHSVSPAVWRQVWDEVTGRFARVESRRAACEMLCGLLSPIERKNGWWLAEQAGHDSPDRIQRLLRTAVTVHWLSCALCWLVACMGNRFP
jgi:hypothetical protein